MKVLAMLVQLAAGLGLAYVGLTNLHVEMERAVPSTVRIALFLGTALFGGLVLPTIGDILSRKAKDAARLAGMGRRAYDGKPEP